MDQGNSGAHAFEEFRLQRKRMQAKLGRNTAPGVYENEALRELENFEAREVRDQQMSREVQEFFSTATKQAAAIVEKVAREAQTEVGVRIQQEMEAFLRDAMERVSVLVDQLLSQHGDDGRIAQADLEARLGNLGRALDTFRWAGTAQGADKHIGQDPFATDVDEVVREFRGQIPGAAAAEPAADIENHLVALTADEVEQAESAPFRAEELAMTPTPEQELERFKAALKALVQQGTMTREEARAAWQTRMASLGLAHA